MNNSQFISHKDERDDKSEPQEETEDFGNKCIPSTEDEGATE